LHDQAGIAGSGLHTRAIVKTERLIQGAKSRVKATYKVFKSDSKQLARFHFVPNFSKLLLAA
jgi:hypothetical protein